MGRTLSLLVLVCLSGCTTDAINVSEGVLAEKVNYHWLLSSREGEKAVFSPIDEKVVLSVRFDYNYRGSYEWYKVEWIEPSGEPYKVVSTRTEFGSHRDLKAELPIRGKMAAALPGLWKVRLSHLGRDGEPDRLLISRLFRIEEMSEEMLAAAPIDPPRAEQRPLAGSVPQGARADEPAGMLVALGATGVTADSPPPRPGEDAPGAADVPEPPSSAPGTSLEAIPEPALPAPLAVAAAAPPEAASDDSNVAPLSRSGVLIAELFAPPAPGGAGLRAPAGASTNAGPASPGGGPEPGCPALYYPPGPGCVEQAPQE